MTTTLGPAKCEDLPVIFRILKSNDLPLDGLADHLGTTLVLREREDVWGSAALEIYGTTALLRSVAVERKHQHQGYGRRLTNAALTLARQKKITDIYLLTTTARDFFARLGFRTVERSQVPALVRDSAEFRSACPATATAMMLELHPNTEHSDVP